MMVVRKKVDSSAAAEANAAHCGELCELSELCELCVLLLLLWLLEVEVSVCAASSKQRVNQAQAADRNDEKGIMTRLC